MNNTRTFLSLATRHLSRPIKSTISEYCDYHSGKIRGPNGVRSWCCWTTFGRLECDTVYWSGQLPLEEELGDDWVADGGSWGQPFEYSQIAHIIIPRSFTEEWWPEGEEGQFTQWCHEQDIQGLSEVLQGEGIAHNYLEFALELKLY